MNDLLSRIRARAAGKAMADLHPETLERVHVASLRSDVVASFASYAYLGALGDYESHVWVRKAIKTIADNMCPLPLVVQRDGEAVGDHALTRLLTAVNDQMSSADIWQQWCVDMLLGGEEGWELIRNGRGNYVEIWPRQPHMVSIVPDPQRRRYYQVAKYVIDDGLASSYDLPPDEFVHFKFYNPRNPWRGIAPISAVRMGILIDVFAQAWSKLFFQKSARPDYALIAPQGLTPTERENYEKLLTAKFGGLENVHKPIILEEGVTDIKFLDFRPRDLEWVEQRKIAREEIGAIFGVPDEIMGWGRDTYENFDTAHWVLWVLTILPLAAFRDTHLTEYFRRVKALKPNEQIITDTSQVAALKKDQKAKIEMLDILARQGYPVNIANAFLGLGLPSIEGGDVGYLPLSLVPVMSAKPTKGFGTRKPRKDTKAAKAVEYDSAEHRKLWDVFVKRANPWERKLGSAVADLMREQEREVLARLRAEKTFYTGKGIQDIADDPFDRDEWEKQYRDEVKPLLREMVKEAGQNALDDISVDMMFDVLEPRVLEFLKARGQRFAERVNETTWTQLKESLQAGLRDGESIPDLAARVESVMGARIRSSGEVIARTEVIGSSNGGALLAWQQSEVVERKEWLAALDDRTRETHIEAHGQTVNLDSDFRVGAGRGPAPGQIDNLPEENINCRCTMTAVLAKARNSIAPMRGQGMTAGGNGHERFVTAQGSLGQTQAK